jgi:hypothetical protein
MKTKAAQMVSAPAAAIGRCSRRARACPGQRRGLARGHRPLSEEVAVDE